MLALSVAQLHCFTKKNQTCFTKEKKIKHKTLKMKVKKFKKIYLQYVCD